MKQGKILIIDEEKTVHKTLVSFFTKLGYRNHFVLDELNEVEKTLKKINVALIICKVTMGWGLSKTLQVRHAFRNTKTKVIYLIPKDVDISELEKDLPNRYAFQVWPFNHLNFRSVIEIYFKEQLRQKQKECIIFSKRGEEYEIRFKEILWIQSEGNYCYLYTPNQKVRRRRTIKEMLAILPKDLFIQIHRSSIIQIEKVDHVHMKTKVVQLAEHTIPIGRKYRNALLERLNII